MITNRIVYKFHLASYRQATLLFQLVHYLPRLQRCLPLECQIGSTQVFSRQKYSNKSY